MVFSGSAQNERKPDNKNKGQEDDSSDFNKGGIKDEIKTHTYFFEVHLKSTDRNLSAFYCCIRLFKNKKYDAR